MRGRLKYLLLAIAAAACLLYYWSDLCLWRVEANLARRNHDAAVRWLERSSWLGRRVDSRTCLLQLRVARRKGDYREVERRLKQAVTLGVPRAEVQRERWLAMAQTGQFEPMQAHWNELIQNARDDEPEIARAYYTWAMLYHKHDIAVKTLELWHADYPADPEPLLLAGRFYQSLSDWATAEKLYRQAFEIAPDNEEIRLALANALQVRLKPNEAIPLYEKHLRLHPDDLTAVRGLAESFATNGDVKKAIELLKAALDKHPDDFWLQKSCGELLLSAGATDESLDLLEKAYQSVPEHANLANSLARALKACGRTEEAEPLFAFVSESQPKLTEMADLEKQLHNDQGNLELRMKIAAIVARYVSRRDAIRWYENLLMIAPNYVPAHQELVQLYQSLGDDQQAQYHANFLAKKTL